MSTNICPNCASEYAYEDRGLMVCPMCAHEWNPELVSELEPPQIVDTNGNPLADGDSVTVIKDLKVSGASSVLKRGTKVKSIRLVYDSSDGHDISCNIDGFGAMKLKSEFVKKL